MKTPRQAVKVRPKKTAKSIPIGFQEKVARSGSIKYLKDRPISLPISSRMDKLMRWTREKKDVIGSWSWGEDRGWSKITWEQSIFPLLQDYKKKKWKEIEAETALKRKRNKAYPIGAICQEAQKRLIDIQLEDLDEIFRFRAGALERVYGFRVSEVFFLLWWDAKHKVCQSNR